MEIELIKTLQSLNSGFLDIFCKIISYLSSYIGFIFCFVLIFIFYKKMFALTFGLTYGVGVGINFILKTLINRPRPYISDPSIINKLSAVGQSFPSGHTLSASIISSFLIYVVLKTIKNKKLKIFLIVIILIFVLLVIFSRMYLGQHYLSDTLAGVLLGVIYSLFALFLYNKSKIKK